MAKVEEMNHRVPGRADTGRMSDSPGISSPKRKAQTALCTGSPSVFSAVGRRAETRRPSSDFSSQSASGGAVRLPLVTLQE